MICEGTVKLKYPTPEGSTRIFPVFYGCNSPSILASDTAKANFINSVNVLRAAQQLEPVERVSE